MGCDVWLIQVVFLDFNHYYAMDAEHHVYLISMLQEVFGSKLCNNCAVESITLDYLWEKKYQVSALMKVDVQHLWNISKQVFSTSNQML